MKQHLLEVRNLSLSFGKKQVLSNISFTVEKGEWVQIKGLNGEGKTTLIKSILQLYPYTGDVLIDGKNINQYSVKELSDILSYVPQRLENIPKLTLLDFLSLYDHNNRKERVINKLGLSSLEFVSLTEMSLGQLQLSVLAQSLLSDPDILILDEPTASLDVENKNKIFDFIKEYTSSGKTVITVNHDYNGSYAPNKILTLSNTHLYDTNVIIGEKNQKFILLSLSKPKILSYILTLLLLIILSILIPSSSPLLLRILWAVVAGGVLSLTGSVFQTIFQNPLASPYTLGLASGSAIGALSAFLLGLTSIFSTSLLATIGGVTSALLLILVPKSRIKDKVFLLLCGIAYASFVSSLSMVLQSFVDTSTAYTYMRWMLGGLAIDDYYSLFLIPLSILSLLPILVYSNQITSLGIDSDIAQVNGSSTTAIRNLVLLFSTLAISVVVAQTGPISFIGLVIPNILFRYYGVNLKPILPISFLVGAIAVLFCDIVTRIMEYYTVLPLTTGVTISVIGSPVLIYLLFKTKER